MMNTTAGTSTCALICSTQLLDTSIEDATSKKKTLVSMMDSVMRLMREVECEEKAAEQAKEEATRSSVDIRVKLDEYKQARRYVEEANEKLARDTLVQKEILATKMEMLQLHLASLLDKGNQSLEHLYENPGEEIKLALVKKESANSQKQEHEALGQASLANEVIWMEKVKEGYRRLKQEAGLIFKLQELLVDCGHVFNLLHAEIDDKCRAVNLLKKELDQAIMPEGIMSARQISSILASSSSSLGSLIIPFQPQHDLAECDVPSVKRPGFGLIDSTNDHVQSANCKCIISVEQRPLVHDNGDFEVSDIKNCYFGENTRDVATRANKLHGIKIFAKVKIKGKVHGNQMDAKTIKKVRINNKLGGNQTFAKSIKNVKINGRVHRNQIFAKSIKAKIKGKLHGNQMVAKSINNMKIKSRPHETRIVANNIKNVKVKGRLHINRMFAQSIKKAKIKGKLHGNLMVAKSSKKVKIKGTLHGNPMVTKSIKKLKIKDEVCGNQMFATHVKKVKIKGLRAVSKRRAAAEKKR